MGLSERASVLLWRISNLLEWLENPEQQLLYLLIMVINVLDMFKKHWMDVTDLSAKLQLAQIDTVVMK